MNNPCTEIDMATLTRKPDARVEFHGFRSGAIDLTPVDMNGTRTGPRRQMYYSKPFRVRKDQARMHENAIKALTAGDLIDVWTTDQLPISRQGYGQSTGEIHTIAHPRLLVSATAGHAILHYLGYDEESVAAMSFEERLNVVENWFNGLTYERLTVKEEFDSDYLGVTTMRWVFTIQINGRNMEITANDGQLYLTGAQEAGGFRISFLPDLVMLPGTLLPESALSSLEGKPIRTLVDHPWLDGHILEAKNHAIRGLICPFVVFTSPIWGHINQRSRWQGEVQ